MASLLTLPMIMLNMGGEMVYILAQRLDAQKVSGEKSQRVRSARDNCADVRAQRPSEWM